MNRIRSKSGFSLVETLVALAILLIVIVGILPVFMRSMRDNVWGRQLSQGANLGVTRFEEFSSLPMDRADFAIPGGQTLVTQTRDWILRDPAHPENGGRWIAVAGTADRRLWGIQTGRQQFNIGDMAPNFLLPDGTRAVALGAPVDGATPLFQVHLRQLAVEVISPRVATGPLTRPNDFQITGLRGY